MRAVAAVAVFVRHAELPFLPGGGWVGVTVFFTLSGYLITALLLLELDRNGSVDLLAFYVRRARRLLPALAVVLPVAGTAALLADDRVTLRSLPFVALYAGNFPGVTTGFLHHSWSLAVEEHFYLLWPALFVLVAKVHRDRLLSVTLLFAAASCLSRVVAVTSGAEFDTFQRWTPFQIEMILIGCALAVATHHRPVRFSMPWGAWALVLACLALLDPDVHSRIIGMVGFSAVAVATAALIGAWTTRSPRVPTSVAAAGRMSYAFYLWHVPLLWWVNRQPWSSSKNMTILVALGLTCVITLISWMLVERRFVRPSRTRPEPGLRLTGPSIAG